eukprot:TRINITY_DN15198_c0_g1_i1.p1 TRINITY_DN15198_c0_g1~~TRINITY_DN15198_c0_g1_i1.p1  ORF type:complete len:319 (-),score=124.28 TRINITY_DN15198_c0_g1_i1:63-1019(-)
MCIRDSSKQYHAAQDVDQKYIRCSLKANDGFLFPCEKFFCFIYKPSTVMMFDEIRSVEFARVQKVAGQTMNTFELSVTMKSDTRYDFNGIARGEYNNLFNFLTDKGITIQNVDDGDAPVVDESSSDDEEFQENAKRAARRERGVAPGDDGDIPDSEEEDESYEGGGSSDDDDDMDDGSDADEGGAAGEAGSGSDDEKPIQKKEKKAKSPKKRKEAASPGKKPKKKKAKKDPNAPKGAKGSYILFGMERRAALVEANPGASVTDVAKLIGAAWKEVSDEDKARFTALAAEDKIRYQTEMKAYKEKLEAEAPPAGDSDSD